jgi:hypothetical protein
VVYSDIDFNGHVNSMKYIEWMVDALTVEVVAEMSALRLDINYLHEARLGETLTICCGEGSGEGCGGNPASREEGVWGSVFDIRNAEGVSICRAEMRCV